MKSNFIYQTSS